MRFPEEGKGQASNERGERADSGANTGLLSTPPSQGISKKPNWTRTTPKIYSSILALSMGGYVLRGLLPVWASTDGGTRLFAEFYR